MPEGENLAAFAATGAVLAIHLSIHVAAKVQAELLPHYGANCPVAIVWRASWPDETVVRTTVGGLAEAVASHMERTALSWWAAACRPRTSAKAASTRPTTTAATARWAPSRAFPPPMCARAPRWIPRGIP
jgi:precorrin-4 methylase